MNFYKILTPNAPVETSTASSVVVLHPVPTLVSVTARLLVTLLQMFLHLESSLRRLYILVFGAFLSFSLSRRFLSINVCVTSACVCACDPAV